MAKTETGQLSEYKTLTTVLVAVPGPLFRMVSVNVTVSPTLPIVSEAVPDAVIFAGKMAVTTMEAELFLRFRS